MALPSNAPCSCHSCWTARRVQQQFQKKGTGIEIRALHTTLSAGQAGLLLDGHKYNISHAPHAKVILVTARYVDGTRPATALVLLDAAQAGMTRSEPRQRSVCAIFPSAISPSST
ncbi:MAG: hypothetical protein CBCREVIR_2806 [Candidatus Burkholderia crenata]|nr:MAG: hypothetical protein CBCREVIR_2806 [Candidatus Burkholderia crenata]